MAAKKTKRRAKPRRKPVKKKQTQVEEEIPAEVQEVQGEEPCDEELALRMLEIYFTEVARFGFKRSLVLDEVINAYFYSLARIQRKDIELEEIERIAKKSKFG